MAATEVEEVEWLWDRINRIDRIEIEEAFYVGDDDWGAMAAEVGADPIGFGRACRDKSLCAAETKALNGSDKSLLPTMISAADWIIAALGHTKTNEPPLMDGSVENNGYAKY